MREGIPVSEPSFILFLLSGTSLSHSSLLYSYPSFKALPKASCALVLIALLALSSHRTCFHGDNSLWIAFYFQLSVLKSFQLGHYKLLEGRENSLGAFQFSLSYGEWLFQGQGWMRKKSWQRNEAKERRTLLTRPHPPMTHWMAKCSLGITFSKQYLLPDAEQHPSCWDSPGLTPLRYPKTALAGPCLWAVPSCVLLFHFPFSLFPTVPSHRLI